MLRAFAVNRTSMLDTEGTRLSRADLMAADFDLQAVQLPQLLGLGWFNRSPVKLERKTNSVMPFIPFGGASRNNFCADCEMDHIWAMIPGAFCSSPDGASQFQCPGLARPLALYYANGLVFFAWISPEIAEVAGPPDRLKRLNRRTRASPCAIASDGETPAYPNRSLLLCGLDICSISQRIQTKAVPRPTTTPRKSSVKPGAVSMVSIQGALQAAYQRTASKERPRCKYTKAAGNLPIGPIPQVYLTGPRSCQPRSAKNQLQT